MANDLLENKSFQERMFAKIRESAGDLLSDEELKKIVIPAIERAFFVPVPQPDNQYAPHESVFVTMVRKHLEARIEDVMKEWLKANEDKIQVILNDLVAKGMLNLVQDYLQRQIAFPMQQMMDQLRANLMRY